MLAQLLKILLLLNDLLAWEKWCFGCHPGWLGGRWVGQRRGGRRRRVDLEFTALPIRSGPDPIVLASGEA